MYGNASYADRYIRVHMHNIQMIDNHDDVVTWGWAACRPSRLRRMGVEFNDLEFFKYTTSASMQSMDVRCTIHSTAQQSRFSLDYLGWSCTVDLHVRCV